MPEPSRKWGGQRLLRAARANPRGFALIIVLWALVLLALILTHVTATGRSEARIARNLASNAVAEAAVDGAVYEAIFRIVDGSDKHWDPGDEPHRLKVDGGEVLVRIESEAGKVNPNSASPQLLASLMTSTGVDGSKAGDLANRMVDWRLFNEAPQAADAVAAQYQSARLDYSPPGEPFETIDELGRVLGMTQPILTALRPHLSLYAPATPDRNQADKVVLDALKHLPTNSSVVQAQATPPVPNAVTVRAEARMADGARFMRIAVVAVGGPPRGYRILAWRDRDAE